MDLTLHTSSLPHDDPDTSLLLAPAAADAEVVREPLLHPYDVRDCAFRDPAGSPVRIREPRSDIG